MKIIFFVICFVFLISCSSSKENTKTLAEPSITIEENNETLPETAIATEEDDLPNEQDDLPTFERSSYGTYFYVDDLTQFIHWTCSATPLVASQVSQNTTYFANLNGSCSETEVSEQL